MPLFQLTRARPSFLKFIFPFYEVPEPPDPY